MWLQRRDRAMRFRTQSVGVMRNLQTSAAVPKDICAQVRLALAQRQGVVLACIPMPARQEGDAPRGKRRCGRGGGRDAKVKGMRARKG